MVCLNNNWDLILRDEFQSEYYKNLRQILKKEYFSQIIYPPMDDIFNAYKLTDFEDVKAKASYMTPVPNGVGRMTVISLMKNVIKAYREQTK